MSNLKTEPEFSKLRQAIWPIHNEELKKFIPMALIMLFILFNYTILRDTKDALIATAPGSGPEVIPFLKGFFVMPAAILFVVIYSRLCNIFSAEKIFYLLISIFLAFFALFAFVLYPAHDILHPHPQTLAQWQQTYPNFKFMFSVIGVWTYSLFYVSSELWGSAMISLLFWQFANEVIRAKEAKRFYPLFILIANVALIFSGTIVTIFSDIQKNVPKGVDAWGISLKYLASAVVLAGICAMLIYRYMHKSVLTDPKYYNPKEEKVPTKKKAKLGVMDSFKYIFQSPYIGLIASLVLCYGVSINLIEILWKKQLSLHFLNDPNGYNSFMGQFSRWTGITTIAIIFGTKNVINRFGWFTGAVITPMVLLISGTIFFALVLVGDMTSPITLALGVSSTYLAVIVGAIQNIFTKGTKYALFDPTKEMAYIPLDKELKTKGKAAVDVIGGRLGKAAGGYTLAFLLVITAGDAMTVAPYLAFVVMAILLVWLFCVAALNKRYLRLNQEISDEQTKRPAIKAVTVKA